MTDKNIQRERVKFWRKNIHDGTNCIKHYKEINGWVKRRNVTTLLDYGCGKGLQYKEKFDKLIGVPREDIDLYDIGSVSHGKLPMAIYEGIIAIDVFNYISEQFLEHDMIELFRRGGSLFVTIPLDSKDPHSITNRPISWWDDVFMSFPNYAEVTYYSRKKTTKRIFDDGARIG